MSGVRDSEIVRDEVDELEAESRGDRDQDEVRPFWKLKFSENFESWRSLDGEQELRILFSSVLSNFFH